MLIRSSLQALRESDLAQRQGQAAMRTQRTAWQESGQGRTARLELAAFANGCALEDLPLLSLLFAPGDEGARAAQHYVREQLDPLVTVLGEQPLAQAPLAFAHDSAGATVVLARHGTTVLSLHVIDGDLLAARGRPQSIGLIPAETVERVMAGTATGEIARTDGPLGDSIQLQMRPCAMKPGDVNQRMGLEEVLILKDVAASLAMLRLQRRTSTLEVVREYRLSDGQLIHQAAGNPNASRLELAASLLGRMGRTDAAPLLSAIAEEEASEALRWQALRECIALDTATGFAALCRIARREIDPLAAAAGALRAQLLETYPQLLEADPCRA